MNCKIFLYVSLLFFLISCSKETSNKVVETDYCSDLIIQNNNLPSLKEDVPLMDVCEEFPLLIDPNEPTIIGYDGYNRVEKDAEYDNYQYPVYNLNNRDWITISSLKNRNGYLINTNTSQKMKVADNVFGPMYMDRDNCIYAISSWQLYRINCDGTSKSKLTNVPGGVDYYSVNSDGSKIVYRSMEFLSNALSNMFVINTSGDIIDDIPDYGTTPLFSPDDKTIAYKGYSSGQRTLNIYDLNSKEIKEVFRLDEDFSLGCWYDHENILYNTNKDIYLVNINSGESAAQGLYCGNNVNFFTPYSVDSTDAVMLSLVRFEERDKTDTTLIRYWEQVWEYNLQTGLGRKLLD